jgi:hypothetical protein
MQQEREATGMRLKYPRPLGWAMAVLGAMALCPVEPALAQQSPAAQRGLTFVRIPVYTEN